MYYNLPLIGYMKFLPVIGPDLCLDAVYSSQAVQDFGSMCQERDAEEVKGVLPYWPRIYCKISVVRWSFTTHSCLFCITVKCFSHFLNSTIKMQNL